MTRTRLVNPDRMTISDLAERLGVNKDTLKTWADQGRLPEPQRSRGGWRYWTEVQAKEIEERLRR